MKEMRAEGAVYKVEKLIGYGQTANVFRAIRSDRLGFTRQTVVLKIPKNKNAVSRVRKEFETLSKIDSPKCVRALAWETLVDSSALVLEWIDGLSLLELGRAVALDREVIQEIVSQVFDAIKMLQEKGLYHGDLSPNNILVDKNGVVRLIDFAEIEKDGENIFGTQEYLAPEVWAGDGHSVQADLFALGLIEIDLLNGFSNVPSGFDQCRSRSFDLAKSDASLLARNPLFRTWSGRFSNIDARNDLSTIVHQLLNDKERSKIQTSVIQCRSASGIYSVGRAIGLFLAIGIASVTPARARAPEPEQAVGASLSLRSQKWMNLSIGGQRIGYSPVDLHDLRAGTYRIAWKTQLQSGVAAINLRPGESLSLTDGDLLRLSLGEKR